jgi:hypothetical protein
VPLPQSRRDYIVKLRQLDTLTINLALGVQLNLSITSATNEREPFPGWAGKRRIQARELVGFSETVG